MSNKRFLVPVLAFAAFGLQARADVVSYCNGGGCGANTTAAFNNLVTTNGYTYASVLDLTFSGSAGASYMDGMTSVLFAAASAFTVTGSSGLRETPGDTITITVPAGYSVIRLSLSTATSGGGAFTYLDKEQNTYAYISTTPQEIDYFDTGGSFVITISPSFGGEQLTVNSFNPAGAGMSASDTPEIGTLLLIGAGLIAMRWMRRAPRRVFRTLQPA